MSKQLFIEGIPISESDYENNRVLKYLSFDNKKAFSEDFRFKGKAFDVIKSKLIDPANGRIASVSVQIIDYCCSEAGEVILDGIIKGDNYNWCDGECELTATVYERNDFLDCIKTLIVSDKMKETGHPNVLAQKQYDKAERINILNLIFVGIGYIPIATMLQLITALPIIPKKVRKNIPDLNFLIRLLNKIYDVYHYPSPYISSYLDNICARCGEEKGKTYTWQSSYFQTGSDLARAVFFNAPSQSGETSNPSKLIQDNRPLKTAEDWLKDLADLLNAKWYTKNDTLFFERKDYKLGDSKLDLTSEKTCYSPASEDPPAFATLYYQDDNDLAGNETRASYDYLHEWNTSNSEVLRGKKEYLFRFGRAKIGKFDDLFKSLGLNSSFFSFIVGFKINRPNLFLKISHLVAGLPKVIVLDANGNLTDNSLMYGEALYNRYFSIDNPNDNNYKAINFEVSTDLKCDGEYYEGMPIIISKGEAIASNITIDYSERKVTFTGVV